MLLLGVGDTHGDLDPLFAVAAREPSARAMLQVGDLTAGKPGREARQDDDPDRLAALPLPLVWVHGNHELWPRLGFDPQTGERRPTGDGAALPGRHLWPGDVYTVPGTDVRVAGLGGNFAPNWYEREKPFPADRVRHFNAAEVAAVERLGAPGGPGPVAVLLLHEAFRGQAAGRLGAMGVPALATLVRRLGPAVCLTGHHHVFAVAEHGPTLALALPRAQEGYVRLRFTPGGERLGWERVAL